MAQSCAALTTPDTMWSFCPSLGASIVFMILFAITLVAHICQAVIYRKAYSWVIIMSAVWQFLTYVFRTLSILAPASFGAYAAWFVLILIAPLWTNAYVYMVFGRMVWNFTNEHKVGGIRASWFGFIFVILDIIALLVQIYGAASATGNHKPQQEVLNALHIYMAGVGIQQFFIVIFSCFAVMLFLAIRREQTGRQKSNARLLLYTAFAVLAFITLRIIFRIVEYSSGLDSTIPNHEAYQYCLDSLPMFFALVVFNLVHPGRIMPGKESDMPSRKERRRQRSGGPEFLPLHSVSGKH